MAAPLQACRGLLFRDLRMFVRARNLSCSCSCSRPEKVQSQIIPEFSAIPDEDVEKIIIPKKKKRDSLSILKALSSTVGKDSTAPHYRYVDDPYLIPASSIAKKTYSLAKASGKKAARYFVDKYKECFVNDTAAPHIEVFMAKKTVYEHTEPTETALLERVQMRKVKDAVEVYNKIKQDGNHGGELSMETKLQFLDLLCIYNCEDPTERMLPEERLYERDFVKKTHRVSLKTWHDDGVAEQLFEELPEKPAVAYCSLIRGMVKYLQTERAFSLYDEMQAQNLPVDQGTFHSLLKIVGYHHDNIDDQWQCTLNLLKDLKTQGLKPTVQTFNCVLGGTRKSWKYRWSLKFPMMVLAEMKRIGVEPSLGTWSHILNIFYNDNTSSKLQEPMFDDIMKYLEGKEFSLQDAEDVEFFANAMSKCCNVLKDVDLAWKIDDLLRIGNNMALIGDAFREGVYYSHFFRLLCMFETLEKIMEYYELIVPNMWTPTFNAIDDLLKAVELHDGYEYLPLIWSDLVLFGFIWKEEMMAALLTLMAKQKHSPELEQKFADIGVYIMDKWENEREMKLRNKLSLDAQMLSDLLMISLGAERFDQAWKIFDSYKQHSRLFSGLLSVESLLALVDGCISDNDADKVIQCLSVMAESAVGNLKEVSEKIRSQMELSDSQRQHIDVIVRH